MLLSLVVIFTQSIQLSKIVCGYKNQALAWLLWRRYPLLSGLETSSRIRVSDLESLNLEQVCFDEPSEENGGADRDRTDDILLAKQALSQLSYSPIPLPVYKILARVRSGGPG